MRLIDADALLLDNTWEWYDEYGNLTVAGRAVENAPTIDAVPTDYYMNLRNHFVNWEPVSHGRWVVAGKTTHYFICSVCGEPGDGWDNYCRSCGARMDGDDNEID